MSATSVSILLLLFSIISSEVVMNTGDDILTISSWTVHFWNGQEFLSEFNISGKLVLATPDDDADLEDKIVLYGCTVGTDSIAKAFKEKGALGVIIGSCFTSPYGRAGYRLDVPREALTSSMTQVNVSAFSFMKDAVEDGDVYVIVSSEDPSLNPNTELKIGGTVILIFGWVYYPIMLIVTVGLLIFELKVSCEATVKLAILIVLIINFAMGIVFTGIDPLGSRRTLSWGFPTFYQIFNIPMMIIAELLVSVFWFKTVKRSLFSDKLFVQTRIPMLVICGIYAFIAILTLITAGIDQILLQNMNLFIVWFYMISIFILSTFHLFVGIYLFDRIRKIKAKAKLKQTSFAFIYKIFGIVAFDMMQVVVLFLFTGIIILSPVGYLTGSMILIISAGLRSAVILSLFSWNLVSTSSTRGSTGKSRHQSNASHKHGKNSLDSDSA